MATNSSGPPLSGVRVVELGTFMSVPVAGMILADLGAEVIKVEPPTGDRMRRFGRPATRDSALFVNSNRGKASVVLDLKLAPDREEYLHLLAGADVLLCNMRPGVADRLGIGDDVASEVNPRLIRLWVTGFGADGPSADEPVYDTVMQARSGLTQAISRGEDVMVMPGYPMDKVTAFFAVQSVLAALYERERRGHGERIDLAMLDVVAYANFPDLFASRTFLEHQPEDPRNRAAINVRPVPAKDGWFVLTPVTAANTREACAAVGAPDLADELLAISDQAEFLAVMVERIAEHTRTTPLATVLARFRAHGVPAAPCLGMDEHLDDAQVVHNDIYRIREVPGFGPVRSVRYPAVSKRWGVLDGGPSPELGAHNEHFDAGAPAE